MRRQRTIHTFSDSESSNASESNGEDAAVLRTDSRHDEEWLCDMMRDVDTCVRQHGPDGTYQKWTAIKTLTLVYHRSLCDSQRDLEVEAAQAQHWKEQSAKLQGVIDTLNGMVVEELERWELVSSDEEEEQAVTVSQAPT